MITICAGDDPSSGTGKASQWLNRYRGKRPAFACVLSFTETALIPHISSAGMTPQARQRTAAADAVCLVQGAAGRTQLPALPAGVSPVVITRAVLTELAIPCHLLSTGLPVPLEAPHIALPHVIARAVNTGEAMSRSQVKALLEAGQHWGRQLAQPGSYLIIGECVVGGTTTAQAVLTALGYPVAGHMSSSHQTSNHTQKQQLVAQGISAWQRLQSDRTHQSPAATQKHAAAIAVLAAVGDPMQAVVAGMLIAASQRGGVLLAGGSQMLAVYALAKAIAAQQSMPWQPAQVAIGTTRWVTEDRQANTPAIARQIDALYLASGITFSKSPYVRLRAYEQGYVKEGMGAGGCAIAAHLYSGWTRSQLRHAAEAQLRQLT
ncbi:MAG: nicotinate mononucleotide-dependent phosphoribosyltransferase CobT [Cyanobacteria bacterium J06614_10]